MGKNLLEHNTDIKIIPQNIRANVKHGMAVLFGLGNLKGHFWTCSDKHTVLQFRHSLKGTGMCGAGEGLKALLKTFEQD